MVEVGSRRYRKKQPILLESGVEKWMTNDIKDYLEIVMKELKGAR
jgi:hypothetical protein